MIRINLLPVKVSRRQEAVKRELLLGLAGLLGLVLLMAGAYVALAAKVNDVQAHNRQLQQDLQNLKAIVARVDEVEKINEELRKKLDVIAGLNAHKTGPVHVLDELSAATPEKLYLTQLKQTGNSITLVGNAASNEVISQFLINLEKSDWFDEVYLISIDQDDVHGVAVKNFEITARIVVPKSKKKGREKKPGAEGGKAAGAGAGKASG